MGTLLAVVLMIALLLSGLTGCDLNPPADDDNGGTTEGLTISPAGGTFYTDVRVILAADNGAPILYSTDGSTPTTLYGGAAISLDLPVTGSTSFTVRAQLQNGTGASTAT